MSCFESVPQMCNYHAQLKENKLLKISACLFIDRQNKMGDVDRIGRINEKINLINSMITDINSEKYALQREMNETNAQGQEFEDFIQEIGQLDQQVWDLKVEKQRLLDLI